MKGEVQLNIGLLFCLILHYLIATYSFFGLEFEDISFFFIGARISSIKTIQFLNSGFLLGLIF
ncbi:MAG: hypothetical protein SO179_09980 [Bacteroidales bacterium]|nr:hypothetical protein [Bacteroidales bacterium]